MTQNQVKWSQNPLIRPYLTGFYARFNLVFLLASEHENPRPSTGHLTGCPEPKAKTSEKTRPPSTGHLPGWVDALGLHRQLR